VRNSNDDYREAIEYRLFQRSDYPSLDLLRQVMKIVNDYGQPRLPKATKCCDSWRYRPGSRA